MDFGHCLCSSPWKYYLPIAPTGQDGPSRLCLSATLTFTPSSSLSPAETLELFEQGLLHRQSTICLFRCKQGVARAIISCLLTIQIRSNIISSQIYRDDDKPLYRRGNAVLIAITVYNIVVFIGMKVFYVTINRCVSSDIECLGRHGLTKSQTGAEMRSGTL